jgi:hypothetical protein
LKRAWVVLAVLAIGLRIEAGPPVASIADGPASPRGDRALIVVGLAGDAEHEGLFRETALAWRRWLTESLQFPAGGIRVVFGDHGEPSLDAGPATGKAIAEEAETIRRTLAPDGRLWVFFLGHANVSGGHAYLHLPGPDLREDELGALFKGITSGEQVFWFTTSASGWFLPGISAPGRIVITATSPDQEFNETEFPRVLAEISRRSPAELDQDKDDKVSVWELFIQTAQAVEERFAADRRAPTEHARLDDNGDKIGGERPESARTDSSKEKPNHRESHDGELAKKTFLRLKVEKTAPPP